MADEFELSDVYKRQGLTLYRLDSVMNGDIDEIIDALITADQAERLKHQEQGG